MRTILCIVTLIVIFISRVGDAIQIQADAILSNATPYIHQTIVYMVRIISQNKVREFNLSPPTISGAALELLERQPRYDTRGNYFIYEYCYVLTPLIAERIEVPEMQIAGTAEEPNLRNNSAPLVNFQIRTKSLFIQTRPIPLRAAQPWLPLQALELISSGELKHAQLGEPFTIQLWLRALGSHGARLPALVDLLQGPDFRVYAELPVEYWQDANSSGNSIRGQRHETLTVVPLRAGILHLPQIKIPWWNTEKDQPMNLEWQPSEITVSAVPAPEGNSSNRLIWFSAVLFLLIGWAIGTVRLRDRFDFSQIVNRILSLIKIINLHPLRAKFIYWLTPISTSIQILRTTIQQLFSKAQLNSFPHKKLIHQIHSAVNAEEIATALRAYANHALHLSPNSPLMIIAEQLIIAHPKLINSSLSTLINQLDATLYGMNEEMDIAQWKQQFHSIAISLRAIPSAHLEQNNLPPLNPN